MKIMHNSMFGALALWTIAMAVGAAGCATDAVNESDDPLMVCLQNPLATELNDDGTLSSGGGLEPVAAFVANPADSAACTLYCWTDCFLPTRRAWHSYPDGGTVETGCPSGQICTINTPQTCAGTGTPNPGDAGEGDSAAGHCVNSP